MKSVLAVLHYLAFLVFMPTWLWWVNNKEFKDLGAYEWKKYASYAAGPVFFVLLALSALYFLG